MEYLSFVSSLSKQDLKDLAKQMKLNCSGNKTELCGRIMAIMDKFENSYGPIDKLQIGGNFEYMLKRQKRRSMY